MLNRIAVWFINWYLEKNHGRIVYNVDDWSGSQYVVRKFTLDTYETIMGSNPGEPIVTLRGNKR